MRYYIFFIFTLAIWWACGGKQVIYKDKPIPETVCKPGEVRRIDCVDNTEKQRLDICNEKGEWQIAIDCEAKEKPEPEPEPTDPPEEKCDVLEFKEVQPIITRSCVPCHNGYDQFDTVRRKYDQFEYRIKLPSSDPKSMPPNRSLDSDDKKKLLQWGDDGLYEECDGDATTGKASLKDIERYILEDITNLQEQDRVLTRYLIAEDAHQLKLDVKSWAKGIQKQANSLSLETVIRSAEPINQDSTIYRFKLDDFGLSVSDWNLIEAEDKINFESFTSEGILIKFLAQTQKPWMHASNWAFVTNQAFVYYNLLKIPNTLAEFLALPYINVNQVDEIQKLRARFVGFASSPITINKNRLIVRYELGTGFGSLWQTYDVFDVQDNARNLFKNPLVLIGNAQFGFQASEVINTMPNGMQMYSLWNAEGGREEFAPTNLVFDSNEKSLDPQIDNSLDCHRCHKAGILPNQDQIKEHIEKNAGQFDIGDVQLVEFLYSQNSAALFNKDNAFYKEQLAKTGNDGAVDTVNLMVDHFRTDYDAEKLAAFLFVAPEDLIKCINRSSTLQQEIGQISSDGTISLEQLENSIPVIFKDCEFNQEIFYP